MKMTLCRRKPGKRFQRFDDVSFVIQITPQFRHLAIHQMGVLEVTEHFKTVSNNIELH